MWFLFFNESNVTLKSIIPLKSLSLWMDPGSLLLPNRGFHSWISSNFAFYRFIFHLLDTEWRLLVIIFLPICFVLKFFLKKDSSHLSLANLFFQMASKDLLKKVAVNTVLGSTKNSKNAFDVLFAFKNFGVGRTITRNTWKKHCTASEKWDCFWTVTRVRSKTRVCVKIQR